MSDLEQQKSVSELTAEMFCELDSAGQAEFFNHISKIASNWNCGGISMQLQYITEYDGLTLSGRRIMQMIGHYSHWGIACKLGRKHKK